MADARPTIFVVDDDASVRDAISNLLESVGLQAKVFESTEAVLEVGAARRSQLPGARRADFPE